MPLSARQVDNAAVLAFFHHRQKRLRELQRSQDIDFEGIAIGFDARLEQPRTTWVYHDAGVIDQDVGATVVFLQEIRECLDACRCYDIEDVIVNLQSLFQQRFARRTTLDPVPAGQHHAHAVARQLAADLETEAAVSAGDNG